MDQDSDDDDSGEPMTKIEDDSDDSDNDDDHEPAFVDVPSTSADDQPGPSGVGKDGVEAPFKTPKAEPSGGQVLKKITFMCKHCKVQYNTPVHLVSHLKTVIPRIVYQCLKCDKIYKLKHSCPETLIKCAYCFMSLEENLVRSHFCFHLISEEISLLNDETIKCNICKKTFLKRYLVPHISKCYNLCNKLTVDGVNLKRNEDEDATQPVKVGAYLRRLLEQPENTYYHHTVKKILKSVTNDFKTNLINSVADNVYTRKDTNIDISSTSQENVIIKLETPTDENNINETETDKNNTNETKTDENDINETETIENNINETDENNVINETSSTNIAVREQTFLQNPIENKFKTALTRGFITKIGAGNYVCLFCNDCFDRAGVIKHLEKCSLSTCRFCYKTFSNPEELDEHISNIKISAVHFCLMCVSTCTIEHGKEGFDHRVKSFCTMCHKYLCYDDYISHNCFHVFSDEELTNHNTKLNEDLLFTTCVHCNKKVPQTFLKTHVLKKHSEVGKSYNCPLCTASFDKLMELRGHQKMHYGFLCHICGKRITKNRTDHMNSHEVIPRHQCSQCGKRFAMQYNLKKHETTHLEKGNYPCSTCKKHFKNPFNLKVHKRIHDAIKPFKCSICAKTFQTKQAMQNHMRVH